MKKALVLGFVLSLVLVGTIGVSASEESDDIVSNMDSETFREMREAQIEEALNNGKITSEEADALRAHIREVAAEGLFGKRNQGEGVEDCELGLEGSGIFRRENAGQRLGGNGIGQRLQDGTQAGMGQGFKGQNRQAGQGYNGVCIVE